MRNSKIILTGYRATGKTSVGKLLAQNLSCSFVDMDKVIEARENCPIADMVKKHGWQYFRKKEKNLLAELTSQEESMVIATGGGAIVHQDIWPKVMAAGIVVWLEADTQTICKRLDSDCKTESQRPSLTGIDTRKEVAAVLAEREPLYRSGCHFSVDTSKKDTKQIAETINKKFQSVNPS